MSMQWWAFVFIMTVGVAMNFLRLYKSLRQQGFVRSIGLIIYTCGGALMLLSIIGVGYYANNTASRCMFYGVGVVGAIYVMMSAYMFLRFQH